jgi:hypothetical protein
VSSTIERVAHIAARRQAATPLLLFVAGHRPLAFFAGQLLYAVEPLGALLGLPTWSRWAALLSDPAQTDQLIAMLDRHTYPTVAPRIDQGLE